MDYPYLIKERRNTGKRPIVVGRWRERREEEGEEGARRRRRERGKDEERKEAGNATSSEAGRGGS